MPIPENYGPRIRPVENWGLKFDPKNPATWRSGAGQAAMAAAEANDEVQLKAVIEATPFVKFVLDFAEQLDAAARRGSDRAAAVLLPWCDVDAWRQCLLIAAQRQDCQTLFHLLCDVDEWPAHESFRQRVTGDRYHPSAKPSLTAARTSHAEATPFREKPAAGSPPSLFDESPFMHRGPWQRKRLLDVLPAVAGGRHSVLQRAAEAACRGDDLPLLHTVIMIAMEPGKVVPFAAVTWQPRSSHWLGPCLERARAAAGATIVQAEVKLGKLRDSGGGGRSSTATSDFLSATVNFNVEAKSKEKKEKERAAELQSLTALLDRKRSLLAALDHYLAVAHGGGATHPHQLRVEQRGRPQVIRQLSRGGGGALGATRTLRLPSGLEAGEAGGVVDDSLVRLEREHQEMNGSRGGGSGAGSRSDSRRQSFDSSPSSRRGSGSFGAGGAASASGIYGSGGGGLFDEVKVADTAEVVAAATEEVIRFDRRAPMRERWRPAGDNPAWRAFVPQWTAENGAHRVWKRKLAARAQMLHHFNELVAGDAEKPPELETGAL